MTVVSVGCVEPMRQVRGLEARTLDQLCALEDDQVDLATASLVIGWDLDRRSSIGYKQMQLDSISKRLGPRLAAVDDPRKKIALLSDILMNEFRMMPLGTTRPRRHGKMLDWVLDHNRGDCVGLSVLYLGIAERLDLPLKLATAPGHVLVVWDDGDVQFYVETTRSESVHDTSDYLEELLGPIRYRQFGGMHLEPLPPRQALGVLIGQWGYGLSEQGRHDDALQAYRRSLAINPRDSSVLFNLARELAVLGRTDEAEKVFARCVKVNPRFADAYSRWGVLLSEQKRYGDALEKFDRALAVNPDDAMLHALAIMTLTRDDRPDEARRRLAAARRRFPRIKVIWKHLAEDLDEDTSVN